MKTTKLFSRFTRRILVIAALCVVAATQLHAQSDATTSFWTGAAGDGNWSTPGNWNFGAADVTATLAPQSETAPNTNVRFGINVPFGSVPTTVQLGAATTFTVSTTQLSTITAQSGNFTIDLNGFALTSGQLVMGDVTPRDATLHFINTGAAATLTYHGVNLVNTAGLGSSFKLSSLFGSNITATLSANSTTSPSVLAVGTTGGNAFSFDMEGMGHTVALVFGAPGGNIGKISLSNSSATASTVTFEGLTIQDATPYGTTIGWSDLFGANVTAKTGTTLASQLGPLTFGTIPSDTQFDLQGNSVHFTNMTFGAPGVTKGKMGFINSNATTASTVTFGGLTIPDTTVYGSTIAWSDLFGAGVTGKIATGGQSPQGPLIFGNAPSGTQFDLLGNSGTFTSYGLVSASNPVTFISSTGPAKITLGGISLGTNGTSGNSFSTATNIFGTNVTGTYSATTALTVGSTGGFNNLYTQSAGTSATFTTITISPDPNSPSNNGVVVDGGIIKGVTTLSMTASATSGVNAGNYLTIKNGGSLTGTLAPFVTAFGTTINVDGSGSQFNASSSTNTNSVTLGGAISVTNGGAMNLTYTSTNSSDTFTAKPGAQILVDGAGSSLAASVAATSGFTFPAGAGLSVTNGASATFLDTLVPGGIATINVDNQSIANFSTFGLTSANFTGNKLVLTGGGVVNFSTLSAAISSTVIWGPNDVLIDASAGGTIKTPSLALSAVTKVPELPLSLEFSTLSYLPFRGTLEVTGTFTGGGQYIIPGGLNLQLDGGTYNLNNTSAQVQGVLVVQSGGMLSGSGLLLNGQSANQGSGERTDLQIADSVLSAVYLNGGTLRPGTANESGGETLQVTSLQTTAPSTFEFNITDFDSYDQLVLTAGDAFNPGPDYGFFNLGFSNVVNLTISPQYFDDGPLNTDTFTLFSYSDGATVTTLGSISVHLDPAALTQLLALGLTMDVSTFPTTGIVNVVDYTGTTPHSEVWRDQYFGLGSSATTGPGADTADPTNDGVSNLIKFATGQDPTKPGMMPGATAISDNNLTFTYTRATQADGEATFAVEWSDDLINWNRAGISEVVTPGATGFETVTDTVDKGTNGRRFMHLVVSR